MNSAFGTPPPAGFLDRYPRFAATPETEVHLLAEIEAADGAGGPKINRLPDELQIGYERAMRTFQADLKDYHDRLGASGRIAWAHKEWSARADRFTHACADAGELMLSGFASRSIAKHLIRQRTQLRVPRTEARPKFYFERLQQSEAQHNAVQAHLHADGASPQFILALLNGSRSLWGVVAGDLVANYKYRRRIGSFAMVTPAEFRAVDELQQAGDQVGGRLEPAQAAFLLRHAGLSIATHVFSGVSVVADLRRAEPSSSPARLFAALDEAGITATKDDVEHLLSIAASSDPKTYSFVDRKSVREQVIVVAINFALDGPLQAHQLRPKEIRDAALAAGISVGTEKVAGILSSHEFRTRFKAARAVKAQTQLTEVGVEGEPAAIASGVNLEQQILGVAAACSGKFAAQHATTTMGMIMAGLREQGIDAPLPVVMQVLDDNSVSYSLG